MGLRGNVLAWHRPVHKIQVKVVRLQISQRLLHLGSHSSFSFVDRCRPHLGREKQLLPRYAALPQRLAHHRFIVVKLGAVKEAVAGFHRVLSNPHAAGHGILGREGAGAIGPADLTAVAKAENRGFILAMARTANRYHNHDTKHKNKHNRDCNRNWDRDQPKPRPQLQPQPHHIHNNNHNHCPDGP